SELIDDIQVVEQSLVDNGELIQSKEGVGENDSYDDHQSIFSVVEAIMETASQDANNLLMRMEPLQKTSDHQANVPYTNSNDQSVDVPDQEPGNVEINAATEHETFNGKLIDDFFVNNGFNDHKTSTDINYSKILEPPPMDIEQNTINDVQEASIIMPKFDDITKEATQTQNEAGDVAMLAAELEVRKESTNSKTGASTLESTNTISPSTKSTSQEKTLAESSAHLKPAAPSEIATGPKASPLKNSTTSQQVRATRTTTPTTGTPTPSKRPTQVSKGSPVTHQNKKEPSKAKPPTSTPMPKTLPPRPSRSSVVDDERSGAVSRSNQSLSTASTMSSTTTTPKRSNKYMNVQSKINSITDHKPSGGNVKIFSQKRSYDVTSRIGSLANANRTPGGGHVVIENRRTDFSSNAKPRIDSRNEHKRSQSAKKIPAQKLEWKAQSKIGSLDNVTHRPTGGNVKIFSAKLEWKAESKVGSTDNIKHKPAGGDVKIFSEKLNVSSVKSKVGSLENANHVPGGGNVNIDDYRVDVSKNARGRVASSRASNTSLSSRKSSPSRARDRTMPGAKNPLTADEVLGLS
uniref:Microtubule-associated protein n=1 Tax=Parascaris univalens TaxID=6257 RepID=A0A915BJT1_PARUN